jgi:hypothetical protein
MVASLAFSLTLALESNYLVCSTVAHEHLKRGAKRKAVQRKGVITQETVISPELKFCFVEMLK